MLFSIIWNKNLFLIKHLLVLLGLRRNYNSTNISTISFDCWDIFSTLYCFINIYKRVKALNTRFWIFYVLTGTKVATKDSQLIIMVRNFIRTSRAQLLSVMTWRPALSRIMASSMTLLYFYGTFLPKQCWLQCIYFWLLLLLLRTTLN